MEASCGKVFWLLAGSIFLWSLTKKTIENRIYIKKNHRDATVLKPSQQPCQMSPTPKNLHRFPLGIKIIMQFFWVSIPKGYAFLRLKYLQVSENSKITKKFQTSTPRMPSKKSSTKNFENIFRVGPECSMDIPNMKFQTSSNRSP